MSLGIQVLLYRVNLEFIPWQGFRMAENLQAKLSTHDTIQLFDTNRAAADRLIQDKEGGPAGGAAIEVFATAAEAAFEAARYSS